MEGRGRGLIRSTILAFASIVSDKNYEKPVMTARLRAETSNRSLPNAKDKYIHSARTSSSNFSSLVWM
jgi:hypothetical protein